MEHFVIRLWVPVPAPGISAGFHGTAQHVRSGTEQVFASEEQLLDFLRRMTAESTPEAQPGSEVAGIGHAL